MNARQVLLLLFLNLASFFRAISGLKHVELIIEPRVVRYGEHSTLFCEYDLEGELLYTLKFYRGVHEFYRYTPKEFPNIKTFLLPGLQVDEHLSNDHQVVLRNVSFNLSGNFSCEVTTEAPLFSSKTVSKDMMVYELPENAPVLLTEKPFYEVGDELRANCTSSPSRPAATLTFLLNNIVVCEKCPTRKLPMKDLWGSENTLVWPLFPSNFQNNGNLSLKCVAQIGDLYQRHTEITIGNVKDPIPARVTQNSSPVHNLNWTIFLLLAILQL